MKKHLLSRKGIFVAFSVLFLGLSNDTTAQDYNWNGATSSDFYTASNWSSSSGSVIFDDSSFKAVRTNASGKSPIINQPMAWRPGIFDNTGGNLTVNADFNLFFNDKLNGTVTVNTGATFKCSNIFRVGREGSGTVNVNGGTIISNDVDPNNWQAIFIGALSGGDGTVNVSNGGMVSGGFQLEIGTRNFYPKGLLNVNTEGTAEAYWATVIGPNGTVNIDGGNLNTGEKLLVCDLFVDNAGTEGTTAAIVGKLNINSGSVVVNQNDLAGGALILNAKAKVVIDNGSLAIKLTGHDFTADVNAFVTAGQIVAVAGKEIVVAYDGVLTTVTAKTKLGVNEFANANFRVYPNPVTDVVNILSNGFDNNLMVTIVSLSGKTLVKESLSNNAGSYSLQVKNRLSTGIYLLNINSDSNNYTTKLIVK